jgi:hypothetical protein
MADDCIGIEPEHQQTFVAFKRLRPQHAYCGTGLGRSAVALSMLTVASLARLRFGQGLNVLLFMSKTGDVDERHVEVSGCESAPREL